MVNPILQFSCERISELVLRAAGIDGALFVIVLGRAQILEILIDSTHGMGG